MTDGPLIPDEFVDLAARRAGEVLRDEDTPEPLRRRTARIVFSNRHDPNVAPHVDQSRAILGEEAADEEAMDDEILAAVTELSEEELHRFVDGLSDLEAHALLLLLNARHDD